MFSFIFFTWQSSPLVRTSPFMYCLSSDGEMPKLLPMQRLSTLPSGWLISTAPFRITYQWSSCRHQKKRHIIHFWSAQVFPSKLMLACQSFYCLPFIVDFSTDASKSCTSILFIFCSRTFWHVDCTVQGSISGRPRLVTFEFHSVRLIANITWHCFMPNHQISKKPTGYHCTNAHEWLLKWRFISSWHLVYCEHEVLCVRYECGAEELLCL